MLVEGPPAGTSDERIWETLLQELQWLHRQMSSRLRATFAPVFVLFELKTIILCLRNKAIQKSVNIEILLSRSLLAERLQQLLRRETDVRSTVATLADALSSTAEGFAALESAYAQDGLKGLENNLTRIYLQYIRKQRLHAVIKKFFLSFIDLRNIMLLYKQLRWEVENGTPFISGGTIEPSRLQELLARKDLAELDTLVTSVTGLKTLTIASTEGAVETALLASLTQKLRKLGRENEKVGLILDYIWRIYIQARNLAVLYHGKELDADTLERELVQ